MLNYEDSETVASRLCFVRRDPRVNSSTVWSEIHIFLVPSMTKMEGRGSELLHSTSILTEYERDLLLSYSTHSLEQSNPAVQFAPPISSMEVSSVPRSSIVCRELQIVTHMFSFLLIELNQRIGVSTLLP